MSHNKKEEKEEKEERERREAFEELKERTLKEDFPQDIMEYCTDPCLRRYLRARDYNVDAAHTMLVNSLKWRNEFKPHLITTQEIAPVLALDTMFMSGMDKKNRPIIYVMPGQFNPNSVELRVKYMVWMLEYAISKMEGDVEQVVLIMDFSDYGSRAKSPDSRQAAQQCLQILQNHYPERLGAAYIINSPWFFNALYAILSIFIHANTKKKLHWPKGKIEAIHKELSEVIDDKQLLAKFGGQAEREAVNVV
eukprot:Phypoly_transcript_16053.p1 GENE.Phypoly_transcript_16053~~Phypoly_transcript_16053.p1  ORF type:complete len:251 (+),score=47.87 Phypoly_transcript_16053:103-855(+)